MEVGIKVGKEIWLYHSKLDHVFVELIEVTENFVTVENKEINYKEKLDMDVFLNRVL